jgi:hypothetical protein
VALLVAYTVSYGIVMMDLAMEPTSWLATMRDGAPHLSLAGWWCLLVSLPLFLFLLARWIWRFIVWSLLLRDLTKLDLQLVPTLRDPLPANQVLQRRIGHLLTGRSDGHPSGRSVSYARFHHQANGWPQARRWWPRPSGTRASSYPGSASW